MEAAAKETRTLSDEDAKKNIYVGKPVSEIIRQESAPEATRGLNRHNVLAPPILRFSKTESEAGAKADDLLVQPGTQGNGLPDLPKHAREVAVIKFEGLPAKGIIMELKTQLQKYQSDLTFREHGVDGKVLIGDELLKFTGNLCSLKLDANRKGNIGLHMILQTGDRVTWLEFFTKLADEMGGKADPRVKEFISRYCDFGHLGGPAEVQVSPDLNFVQGCHKMVASNFAESQIEGLKGLKLALEFCACGDSLSRSFGTAVEKALDSAADSKNLSVLRLSTELLVSGAKVFSEDKKMSQQLYDKLVRIRKEVAPKTIEQPNLEIRRIMENIKTALSILPSSSSQTPLAA